jgi:hypothetical protein
MPDTVAARPAAMSLGDFSDLMGHADDRAGDGVLAGASDPRADGIAAF